MTSPTSTASRLAILDLQMKMIEEMVPPFVWRSPTEQHRKHRQELISLLLAQLELAARETDPARGEDSEPDKDQMARRALHLAGELVEEVAGWALDHLYGLSLSASDLRNEDEVEAADLHIFEILGADTRAERHNMTAGQRRGLLRDLLEANSGSFPPWLCDEGSTALDALSFGEIHPLFVPDKQGLKAPHSELLLQLKALQFIEYRTAFGFLKRVATDKVSDAYAVAPKTLLGWEYRLKQRFGGRNIVAKLERARVAGEIVADLAKRAKVTLPTDDSCDPVSTIDCGMKESIEDEFGDTALQKHAAIYRNRDRS